MSLTPQIQSGRLGGDLRWASIHLPHLHSGVIAVLLRAGPRFESPAAHGLSHFCEHMLFRGAGPYRSAAEIAQALDEAGGDIDAATYRDHVIYCSSYAPRHLAQACRVVASLVSQPAFKDIEIERAIVDEELREVDDARGRDIDADNLSRRLLLGRHPLSRRIDGSRDRLARFGRRQLRNHHRRFYTRENMTIVVAGPDRPRAVADHVRRHFALILPGARRPLGPPPQLNGPGPQIFLRRHRAAQTEIKLSFLVPGEQAAEAPALSLLRRILDDGMGSRLPQELIEQRGLAYELWADVDLMVDVGVVDIGAMVAGHKVAQVVTEILASLRRLAQRGPDRSELTRTRRRALWAYDAVVDQPQTLAEWVGRSLLFDLDCDFDRSRQRLLNVQTRDLQTLTRRWLHPRRAHLVVVGETSSALHHRLQKTLDAAMKIWPD